MKKAIITKQDNPCELPYNCQIWHQFPDGSSAYCGNGRYCATFETAVRWGKANGAEMIESKEVRR